MSTPEYKYQTIQINGRASLLHAGPSSGGKTIAGAVDLFHRFSVALNSLAVDWRIKTELKKMQPKIDKAIKDYKKPQPQPQPQPQPKSQPLTQKEKNEEKCLIRQHQCQAIKPQSCQGKKPKSNLLIGCLVEAGIQESRHPDTTGTKAKIFAYIKILGVGTDPKLVLKKSLRYPSIYPIPKGWVLKRKYIWVTKPIW